jgi:indolepyruvate ferredoxin oxidoreductase beta subunit
MNTFKITIAGVGGQGTLLASRLIAQSAIDSNLSVIIGETYGMAQRGGPVMGHIQIGGDSYSPQIRPGEADVLLGFEMGEAVRRGVTYLKNDGLAIINSKKLPPVEVISGMMEYPEQKELLTILEKVTDKIISFDATKLAEKAGDAVATNVIILGALSASGLLPFTKNTIIDTIKQSLRPNFHDLNIKALDLGYSEYLKLSS